MGAKFVGTLLCTTGEVALAQPNTLPLLQRISAALSRVGLASYPVALLWAISIKALPTCLYGGEIPVLRDLAGVMLHGSSPFCSPHFLQLLGFLQWRSGLPENAFNAPVYQLYQLRTFTELVLPCVLTLLDHLSPIQWACIHMRCGSGSPLGGVRRLAGIA